MSIYGDEPYSVPAAARGRPVSYARMSMYILGCIVSLPLCYIATMHSRYPVSLDLFITIALAELARFCNEGRRLNFYNVTTPAPLASLGDKPLNEEKEPLSAGDPETGILHDTKLECMAAVVGWREDPALFTRAMESYKTAKSCSFLLVGIDGDEKPDLEMMQVFNRVYPDNSMTLHIPDPFGEVAESLMDKLIAMAHENEQPVNLEECHQIVIRRCMQLARAILDQENNISFTGPNAIRQLCIRQRHMHKKGIMFTTYIFALVIADILGIEFLWSSDSDTIVSPDSLHRTIDTIAADTTIGGASSGLVVHNAQEAMVTKLASTVYWGELYLTRSTPAAAATSDCQSGPTTVFRLSALPPILVPWYLQTLFGKRMIINEDRHLTTNLLKRGWRVVFASDVLAATDTPNTLSRWLKQQVRWARATHMESLLQPRVYLETNPLLFYSMARREFGPVIAAVAVVYYFCTTQQFIAVSVLDLVLRVIVSVLYNFLRNPHRLSARELAWVAPGIFFYHVPLPAVHVWSMMTLTADGWGTTMRSSAERAKKDDVLKAWWETGFFVVWMGIVAGCVAKYTMMAYGFDRVYVTLAMAGSVMMASGWAWKVTIANA